MKRLTKITNKFIQVKEKGRYNYDVTATNIRAGVISIAVIQPVYGTLLFLRLRVAHVWTTKGTYSIYIGT